MTTRLLTEILVVATAVIWIAWDIRVATNSIEGDTESEVIRDHMCYPIVPAALGTVLGHWTLLGMRVFESGATGLFILLGLAVPMALWSVLVRFGRAGQFLTKLHRSIGKRPYIPAVCFYLLGGLLWGLNPGVAP